MDCGFCSPRKQKSQSPLASPKPPTHLQRGRRPASVVPLRSAPVNAVYYPNWAYYTGQYPSALRSEALTHVFYAFLKVLPDGALAHKDEYLDTQVEVDGTRGCIQALVNKRRSSGGSHLRIIISIGGGGEGSRNFVEVAKDPFLRKKLAVSAREFVNKYELDGVDIDWEHPSTEQEGFDYVSLLEELREVLPAPRYLLTTALPAGEWILKHIDLTAASEYLDMICLMAYDFTGSWSKISGHQAQLYCPTSSGEGSGSAGVEYTLSKRVSSRKIILGIPLYGWSFLGTDKPGQPSYAPGGNDGVFQFKELPRPGADEIVDRERVAAYCCGGDGGFVTYDNPVTVKLKAGYVKEKGLGGFFYWSSIGDAVDVQRSLICVGSVELQSP